MSRFWLRGLALVSALGLGAVITVAMVHTSVEYRSFSRPDGKYRVVVTNEPTLLMRLLGRGGGSDEPGAVRLYDKNGNLLQTAPVELAQMVNVEWTPNRVFIPLIADWSTPD
jgi:hypothetical protein